MRKLSMHGWTMKVAFSSIVILLLVLGCRTPRTEVEPSAAVSKVVISDGSGVVLTVANFVRIQQFILERGQRQTYCNKFNDNPYWPFPGFNAYLNPSPSGGVLANINCVIGESEFNTLVIQAVDPIGYWHVSLDTARNRLAVRQPLSDRDREILVKEASEFFLQALVEIDKQTRSKESHSGPLTVPCVSLQTLR